jgi:molybdopterin-guanine dinucleotide biosynthesis protein A
MIEDTTGVILAGGKSSRMGTNKALLPFQESTLIRNVAIQLSNIFSRVLLSVNSPDAFSDLGLSRIMDHYPETGPLGGIASVLESGEKRIFCVGCDMPFLNLELITTICNYDEAEAVIPIWNNTPEVLHALYSSSLLPAIQNSLKIGLYKITDALEHSVVRYIPESEIIKMDPDGSSFRNINTPAEYKNLTNS